MKKTITELFKIKYPIILGGMGNISSPNLVAAVSNAGGLGTIGCGTMNISTIEKLIIKTKKLTSQPFALNIPINVNPYIDEIIQLTKEHNINIISLSAGDPTPYIKELQAHGIKTITIIATVKHAIKAEEAGTDAIVAEGFEAAGINSTIESTTMTLIPQVIKHVNVPVIAAGGIGDGKGLAACLMLGAQGVQMGTRFIATKEAPFHDQYKKAILHASDQTSKVIGRSINRSRRVLPGPYITKLLEKEKEGITPEMFDELTNENKHKRGALQGDFKTGYVNSGQIAGLIDSIPSVDRLIQEIIKEAKMQINSVQASFNHSL